MRVELPGAGVEVLITSLTDHGRFRHREFQGLYQLRWGVEESFKALKCRVEVENWTGKYPDAVYQDFHAKIVTTNLTAVFASEAQVAVERRTRERVLSYRVNFAHALSKMKNSVVLLLTRQRLGAYVGALLRLYADTIEPIRPNRSYPRRPGPKLQGFHPCYKPAH